MVQVQLLFWRSCQLESCRTDPSSHSCRHFGHQQVRSSQSADLLQLEEALLKEKAFTVVFQLMTEPAHRCWRAKMTCSYDRAVFILLLLFHLCARRLLMKSAHRTMLPIVRCLDGWMHVQNNEKNKTEHIVLGVAEARFGKGGRKKPIHYSVENGDGSCFFSLFPHAFFHLSCDAKFLTSPPSHWCCI